MIPRKLPNGLLVLVTACGVTAFLASVTAEAHAILIDSQPAIAGTVKAGPVDVTLRYNSRIDARRSRLTLTRPDHSQTVMPISPGAHEDVLITKADLSPGAYVLRWQVLAVDGHITRGDVPFTVGP
ncbi:MAG TPA: copper resistance CopC family protein [Acetobacteraceae bacterium]